MLDFAPRLLEQVRSIGQRFFLQFGLHCATHQIRVILICGIVITSLFYPALSLYSSTQPNSLSILDSFLSPLSTSAIHAQQDLTDLWTGHERLRVKKDAVSRARCGNGRILRVERLFIQCPLGSNEASFNQHVLQSTMDLENTLNDLLLAREVPCVKDSQGRCVILSPLTFWDHDKEAVNLDSSVMDTLSSANNISFEGGIPLTPEMVLAGRGSNEAGTFDSVMFLALTFFLPDTDCLGNSERSKWAEVLGSATKNTAELIIQPREPTLVALAYNAASPVCSPISWFVYLAYTAFLAYVTWSMQQMTNVHSRVGVTFTALVEITVSTVTSLSVCALFGFKITMVPWELLPILIIFVGAENMFNLAHAVSNTPITLPVKQRVAEGLSHAGTSNTLKVVAYNSILGFISLVSSGAMRQFCVFAVVVLTAHWFLAHTMFLTVLSIDLQRLELEELLRQDASAAPQSPPPRNGEPAYPVSSWTKFPLASIKHLLRGRARKNLSLLLLLASTATLYIVTSPPVTITPETAPFPLGALTRPPTNTSTMPPIEDDPALTIWRLLNPTEEALHLRIEMPSIVTFRPDLESIDHPESRSRFSFKGIRWFVKFVVLPISITLGALWALLVNLLKNTELLEAQRDREDADGQLSEQDKDVDTPVERKLSFSTLERAFESDIELVCTSSDGAVVVSVGLRNEVVVWNQSKGTQLHVNVDDILLGIATSSSMSVSITCIAVNKQGSCFALGTTSGAIAVWAIQQDTAIPLPHMSLDGNLTRVTDLTFLEPKRQSEGNVTPKPGLNRPQLLASYENSTVAKWSLAGFPAATLVSPTTLAQTTRAFIVQSPSEESVFFAFSFSDGRVEILPADSNSPSIIATDFIIQGGNELDTVAAVHLCTIVVSGESKVIIAVATEAGVISLWDGQTKNVIRVLDDVYGRIDQMSLSPVATTTCHVCHQQPMDSFSLTFSVNGVVRFLKLYFTEETQRCFCTHNRPRRMPSHEMVDRSRSTSIASAGPSSPVPRRRKASVGLPPIPAFPLSGHGVHSRKESNRRSASDTLQLPTTLTSPVEEDGYGLGPPTLTRASISFAPSFWRKMIVMQAMETSVERGGWGTLHNGQIIGVRRRPRQQGRSKTDCLPVPAHNEDGLSSATLNRWEVWLYVPSSMRLQLAPLSSVIRPIEPSDLPAQTTISSCVIPRLPFTRVTPFVISKCRGLAGFGNTLGIVDFSMDF